MFETVSTSDRRLPTLSALALADRDHPFHKADVLDPELYQFGRAGAGLQQGLQHQPGAAALRIGLIKKPQFLLDRQPTDAAAPLGRSPQTGALPGGSEHRFALGIVDPVACEDGGNGGCGSRDGGHGPVCSVIFGLQTGGVRCPG
jgi:hypothetical protein